MIGSRLRERRVQVTVDVLSRNSASAETTAYGNIVSTHTQRSADEILSEFGNVVTEVVDVFYFERLRTTGALPVILEKHVIRDIDGAKYEAFAVVNQGGEGNRLAVATNRVR